MIPDLDDINAWQYKLPEHLIASRPASTRDASRLMVVDRAAGSISHRCIRDLPDLLNSSDRLVFNNTKVLPARLFGFRTSTGGKWEGLFLEELPDSTWRIIGQTRGRLVSGEFITLIPAAQFSHSSSNRDLSASDVLNEWTEKNLSENSLCLELRERCDDGSWIVACNRQGSTLEELEQFGTLPLPPYIGRKVADAQDRERYQTVFAEQPGAIAAPTAGLHFTDELLRRCREKGIERSEITLHVGIGTFRPVATAKLSQHQMHSEWCRVPPETAAQVTSTKQANGQVVAVGTTTVRTLEAASEHAELAAWEGSTSLFIRPGYQFRVVDKLLTNFHLPGSTLLALVAALAGYDLTMEAYRTAVREEYRFYSYGDAMLIT